LNTDFLPWPPEELGVRGGPPRPEFGVEVEEGAEFKLGVLWLGLGLDMGLDLGPLEKIVFRKLFLGCSLLIFSSFEFLMRFVTDRPPELFILGYFRSKLCELF